MLFACDLNFYEPYFPLWGERGFFLPSFPQEKPQKIIPYPSSRGSLSGLSFRLAGISQNHEVEHV
jgi:hypothetical protein